MTKQEQLRVATIKTDREILIRYLNGTLDEVGLGVHHVEEVLSRRDVETAEVTSG